MRRVSNHEATARASPFETPACGGLLRVRSEGRIPVAMSRQPPLIGRPHRSLSASRAPSKAKPPANARRSHAITRGRLTTRSRTAEANSP